VQLTPGIPYSLKGIFVANFNSDKTGKLDLSTCQSYGLEEYRLFYGFYRAVVKSIVDEGGRGRVKVAVFGIHDEKDTEAVAEPVFAGAGPGRGWFWPAEVGDHVWVTFKQGNPSKVGLYFGGSYAAPDEKPQAPRDFVKADKSTGKINTTEAAKPPCSRGFQTRAGHRLVMCDEKNKESVKLIWHKPASNDAFHTKPEVSADTSKGQTSLLAFSNAGFQVSTPTGNITLSSNGNAFIQDGHGNKIMTQGSGISLVDNTGANFLLINGGNVSLGTAGQMTLQAGGPVNIDGGGITLGTGPTAIEPVILGNQFKAFFDQHIHPTGVGPSGPPIVKLTVSDFVFSKKTKVQ
jgi:hypothetical protein